MKGGPLSQTKYTSIEGKRVKIVIVSLLDNDTTQKFLNQALDLY